jgi:hypothetical protein
MRSHGGGMGEKIVPGPLTLRMMERVVSSMNSTRTWVTPPREPMSQEIRQRFVLQVVSDPPWPCPSSPKRLVPCAHSSSFHLNLSRRFLSASDGGLSLFFQVDVPVRPRTRVTLTSLTGTFADSILMSCVMSWDRRREKGVDGDQKSDTERTTH